jgi:heterodisulfide reductase subunit A
MRNCCRRQAVWATLASEIDVNGDIRTVNYGAAVLATGGRESMPDEYEYGNHDRILTHLQFDQLLETAADRIETADSAVFIQCVGSRDERRPYCSRVCCTHTVQSAIELKTINPQMNVYVLYRDIRTYGVREDLVYTSAADGRHFHPLRSGKKAPGHLRRQRE